MNNEKQVSILNIDDILPNRFQPRIKFNDQAINELAESIKIHGVIQPIVVRRISDKYEIIAGERRYKASILAGKDTIPALVTNFDDKDSAEIALIENVQRQDLTPIEEAISYKKILDMGYISQTELGEKLGKKQSTIANKLRLLNLNDEVQEALMENKISERHARSLLKLDDKNQIFMLNRIVNERLTVRKTDEEIEKLINSNVDNNIVESNIKEKEDKLMNEDILKEFNIPTNPIIEDNNDSIVFDEEQNDSVIENNINPGFMDLNKIQNEAQDIIKEPEPVANMEELLKSTEPSQPILNSEVQEQNEQQHEDLNQARTGKFFNMFNFNEPEKDENFIDNLESQEVNMDFGESNYNNVGTSIFEQPINQNSMNNEPVEQSVDNNIPEENNSVSETVIEPIKNEFDNNVTTSIDESIDTVPTFENTVTPFSLTDEQDFKISNDLNKQENNIIQENIRRPYMMNEDVTFDDEGEIEVKVENPRDKFVAVDMKTVINTIRDCAKTIEKYGYKIDTDEIDLSDSYEVTFHIEKK